MNEIEELIKELIDISIELHARETSNNCVYTELLDKSWTELCERAIEILNEIK
jgi:predicted nucleic-acid-binding Zn-ribbon protein